MSQRGQAQRAYKSADHILIATYTAFFQIKTTNLPYLWPSSWSPILKPASALPSSKPYSFKPLLEQIDLSRRFYSLFPAASQESPMCNSPGGASLRVLICCEEINCVSSQSYPTLKRENSSVEKEQSTMGILPASLPTYLRIIHLCQSRGHQL